jgi:hypothetical protein
MPLLNTFDALDAVVNTNNPTDVQLKEAFREIRDALQGIGGRLTPVLVLDVAGSPTDIIVQAQKGGVEVFDGMMVAMRSASDNTQFKLWQRHAGAWRTYVAGP